MAGNEKKIDFAIGAKLSSNFKTSLGQAQGAFTDLSKMEAKFGAVQLKTAKDIEKMNNSISKSPQELKKLNEGFKSTGVEIEKVRHKMDLTSKEMEHDKSPQLKKKYKELEKELEKLGSSYVTQKNKIDNHVTKVEKEKKSVDELNKKYSQTSKELEKINKLKEQQEKIEKRKKTIKKLESTSKGINNAGNKAMGAGAVGIVALTPLISQAIESESAFADVKKQFDFKDKKEEEAFKSKMQKLITEKNMAISLTDLYGAAAAAGQRGVKLEDLEENIVLTTKMAVAMDMDKQQAAEMGLGMKQAFGMTMPQLEQMLDQINYLTNTTGAAATPLINYQNRVGSLGKIAGFTAGQTAAVGATLLDMNMDANVAATGVNKMMVTLAAADKATDKQVESYHSLGLNYKNVSKDMQKDAEGTLVKVLEKISKLDKSKQVGVIKELFGQEAITVVSNLVNGTGKLKKNLDAIKNKKLFKGSMNKEYEERLKTTANALENLKGRAQILATNLGGTLLPEVNKFIKYLGDLSGKLVKLQKQDPAKFEKYMKIFLYGTIGLTAFGAGLKIVSGTLNSFITIMKTAGWVAETAIGKKTVGALKSLAKQEVNVTSMSGALGALGAIGVGWTIGTAIGELINDLIKLLGYDEQVQKFVDILTFGDSDNAVINGYEKKLTPQVREAIKRNPSLMGKEMEATYKRAGRKPFDREIVPNNDYGDIPQHARGGIFNDSHLGIFGEAGAEALIPINGSANSRNLWEATGRLIGASSNSNYTTENTKSNFSFNPVYNINGNMDKEAVSEVAKSTFRDFEKEFSRWEKERMRRR